jgi:hypothetical protein
VDTIIGDGTRIVFGKHPYSGKVRLVINGHSSEYDLYSPEGSGLEIFLENVVHDGGRIDWNSTLRLLLLSSIVFGAVAGLLYGLRYGLRLVASRTSQIA